MGRKPKPEVERKVIEDFSHAKRLDDDTIARLFELVIKQRLKGHAIEIVFGIMLFFAVIVFIYSYFFR